MILLVRGPDGRYVELSWNAWAHVLWRHPHMVDSLMDVVLTIEQPDYRGPDTRAGRERLFKQGGPDRWIRVVLEFAGDFDRVVTSFSQCSDPMPRDRR